MFEAIFGTCAEWMLKRFLARFDGNSQVPLPSTTIVNPMPITPLQTRSPSLIGNRCPFCGAAGSLGILFSVLDGDSHCSGFPIKCWACNVMFGSQELRQASSALAALAAWLDDKKKEATP